MDDLQPRSLAISGEGVLKFSRLIAAGLAQFTLMMQNGPMILYEVHLSPKGIQLVDAWITSYILYPIGWLIGLIGKLTGVPGIGGAE